MPEYVLFKSTSGARTHSGYVRFHMPSQLAVLVSGSLGMKAGDQFIHTASLEHDGPGPEDSVYEFEEWMAGISEAARPA